MQKVQAKENKRKQSLKLSCKHWTSTRTPMPKFYS